MPLEILVGAAVGAGATSQGVRKAVRRGAAYGLAGALIAYDRVSGMATGLVRGAREAALSNGSKPQQEETCSAAPPTHDGTNNISQKTSV